MWNVSDDDFKVIRGWGLDKNPFKAIDNFHPSQLDLRLDNKEHIKAHSDYIIRRKTYIKDEDFDKYYKEEIKPIDPIRWKYLMLRKAWFIMPLGWDQMAKNGSIIIDFGCGDGDTIQRLIEYIDKYWKDNKIINRKIKIIGLDLNASRIMNAKKLVHTENPNIEIEFRKADLVNDKLPMKDNYCDYGLCTGVLEILNNTQYHRFIKEMSRLISKGLYIEDLFDEYPGGYPRENIEIDFQNYGFSLKKREVILSEPFDKNVLTDPKKLWPIMKDQNLYLEK
jgi:SAM-dependent methyltransferase